MNKSRAMTTMAAPHKQLLLSQIDEERKGPLNAQGLQSALVSKSDISREKFCEPLKLTEVSMLTSADKVIKRCEKELATRMKGRRESLPGSKENILKFKSVDSYAYGEQQLIYFVEIREYLRERAKEPNKPLELVLISLGEEKVMQARSTVHS